MRGWGARSHGLSGPKRAAHTPTQDKEASFFSRQVQRHQSHSVGGTAWLCQETGRCQLVPGWSSPSVASATALPAPRPTPTGSYRQH